MSFPKNVPLVFLGFFLRLLREAVADGEQGVAAHGIGPCLGATLCIDVVAQVADLSEEIVAAKLDEPLTLMEY